VLGDEQAQNRKDLDEGIKGNRTQITQKLKNLLKLRKLKGNKKKNVLLEGNLKG